jgi:hypothetical protein
MNDAKGKAIKVDSLRTVFKLSIWMFKSEFELNWV